LLVVFLIKYDRTVSDPLTLDIRVEDLIERDPGAVGFLLGRGVRCFRRGERLELFCRFSVFLRRGLETRGRETSQEEDHGQETVSSGA
jgi:hypothetical protein